jgi:pyruvate ferredoxin oxidoreductase alpha subunit
MDRACSFGGNGGPLFHEIRHAIYDLPDKPKLVNRIFGLGGRDIPPYMIDGIYKELQKIAETGEMERMVQFIGLRE